MNNGPEKRLAAIFSERTSRIVFWVGAGLSRPAGVPGWEELRARLTNELEERHIDASTEHYSRRATGIRQIENNWKAFSELQQALGRTTFAAAIRSHLNTSHDAEPPELYNELWRARPSGIVSLNIDGLCARSASRTTSDYHRFVGMHANKWLHVIKQQLPFLIQIHGQIDDQDSWVFTESDLQRLRETESYSALVSAIFATFTVVFVGVSADDKAAGGLLSRMFQDGLDLGQHFWITDRRDLETTTWAEGSGLQTIGYDSRPGHQQAILALLARLTSHRTSDEPAEPVIGAPPSTSTDTASSLAAHDPISLASMHPEVIRNTLASMARSALRDDSADDSTPESRYRELCSRYSRAIHNTWFVSEDPPDNVLFGYTIIGQAGPDGGFGRVFRGVSSDSSEVAIKLLKQDVFQNSSMLDAYRRGVRSLKILSSNNVSGVVKFIDAYELPPALIMEYIDGTNLEELVRRRNFDGAERLRFLSRVSEIVLSGHRLPERVLHRDIRPANIIIRDSEHGDGEVFLIDFDLSYHRGALEKSVDSRHLSAFAYLAPEQLDSSRRVSTRHASVDSFGLGMTAYFVLTETDPIPGASSLPDWASSVSRSMAASNAFRGSPFESICSRAARFVVGCTRSVQSARTDFGVAHEQLVLLNRMLSGDAKSDLAEVWAEELFCRSFGRDSYSWSEDHLAAKVDHGTGSVYVARAIESDNEVKIEFTWQNTGARVWNELTKQLAQVSDKGGKILKQAGWRVETATSAEYQIQLVAYVTVGGLKGRMKQHVGAIQSIQTMLSNL